MHIHIYTYVHIFLMRLPIIWNSLPKIKKKKKKRKRIIKYEIFRGSLQKYGGCSAPKYGLRHNCECFHVFLVTRYSIFILIPQHYAAYKQVLTLISLLIQVNKLIICTYVYECIYNSYREALNTLLIRVMR